MGHRTMNSERNGVGRRQWLSSGCVVEALEGRAMLAAGGAAAGEEAVPRLETLSGTAMAKAPARHEIAVKAGERYVFSARSGFDVTELVLVPPGAGPAEWQRNS